MDLTQLRVVESVADLPADATDPSTTINIVVDEGCQVLVPLAGLFDVKKELARLGKQRTKIEKELGGINGKLKNPKFMEKASKRTKIEKELGGINRELKNPKFMEKASKQQQEAMDKLAVIDAKIEQVTSMAVSV
eukprot:gene28850-32038_t